jgi:hypothetical protein
MISGAGFEMVDGTKVCLEGWRDRDMAFLGDDRAVQITHALGKYMVVWGSGIRLKKRVEKRAYSVFP